MKDVMGIIYTGENDARLRELTIIRAIAALPVAGRFRVIDFLVSSMVNGGMKNIGVIMQKNYHSLMDHLGSGKEWDLHGKTNGLHILPPFLTRENVGLYPGVLDGLRSNTDYLNRSKQELVVLSNSNIIYNAHFKDMIAFYENTGADITLMYTKDPTMKRDEFGTYISLDEEGNVKDIEVEPTHPNYENTFMQVCLMKREFLKELVDKAVAHGLHDLARDLLLKLVQEKQAKVNAFEYTGVCWNIDSVQSYFKFNMDILKPEIRKRLFIDELPVFTKVRDEMPAFYSAESHSVNSLVADGCQIEGKIENSVLFRGVRVAPNAHVKNCIIMQDGQVQEGAYIENCILDKQTVIKKNTKLIGPEAYPIVIAKNVVI
ncbi:glucose-1-phosphate adenylyltransferase subunit GlgD [Aristaeella hokkaidonensis]|uniref:Glucose-1-phosphate adenylyltransferase subunit GlgD n=1 Tax=Aristaeella hokkaidonensis TaxID=3046382 RepID=A0AC61MYA2_9FIRM|nr:glucose-1-phosphate adenylyltransferase subunit GlgD [Aristaeella hokkaidonensis]QUC67971.1 glucose-1-phosphate adenylyltransferase subunit GlgD [Aristaeella hokkaidonensis]SNT93041.1 glucose-1-phosphate adenylyltransferase [Aristaeella hokkaidonensis]